MDISKIDAKTLHQKDVELYDYLASHSDNLYEVGAKKYFKDESVVPEWVLKEIEEYNRGIDRSIEMKNWMPVRKNPKFEKNREEKQNG